MRSTKFWKSAKSTMWHESVVSFILEPPNLLWLTWLKVVFMVFSAFLVFVVFFFGFFRSEWLQLKFLFDAFSFFGYKPAAARKTQRQWAKIVSRLEKGLESEYKLAVIEADSFLDDILVKMNLKGESMVERLESAPRELISNVKDIESAHKIRNNIVHDPDYRLELEETKKAVDIYARALADLEIL
ncbi:MAG: hypothetical protein G01um101430_706 [Parcubacteria group bacterium Gr01-1014_30]|nr:MAG: hypothetical protein G01um101430_706 [Parcubacteria group bacterium Gr01-1014_30]